MDTLANKIPEIAKWIESNPLIVTLTSGGAIVWLFANLKNLWSTLVQWIKALVSFEITNTYEDSRGCGNMLKLKQIEFNNLLAESKAIWERTVNLDLSNTQSFKSFDKGLDNTSYVDVDNMITNSINAVSKTVNTYGFSMRILCGKLVMVDRSYKLDGQKITMNTSIRVFFASKKKYMKKLEDAIAIKIKQTLLGNSLKNTVTISNGTAFSGVKMKRSLDSIFTKNDVHKELFNCISNFISNRNIYKKLNYPYNFCGLLYGVPGSGKTSTILAIASALNRNVYYVNMADVTITTLLNALNDDPDNYIYVFEDIDAVSYKNADARKNDNNNNDNMSKLFNMSLSDLLNVTDGLLASDGTICLFTTNHIDKLDSAFLRAGRMNKCIEFTYMDHDVSSKMVEAYLNVHLDNMKDNIKPAELQEYILDVLLKKKTIEDLKQHFCNII